MATSLAPNTDNELIVCPICFDIFRDPKSLPFCLHTFCKSCIKAYVSSAVTREPDKVEFNCPVCRRSYDKAKNTEEWLDNLPNNHLIANLIGQRNMQRKEEACDYCKRQEKPKPAISWCSECCDRLCETCVEFHSVNRLTMEHKVCHLEDQSQTEPVSTHLFCQQHASRKLEVYCFDHEEPCCLMCATVSHRKCEKVSSLDECSQNSAHEVPQMLERFEELAATCDIEITRVRSDKENLCKESTGIETSVKAKVEEIVQVLKEKENTILAKLEESEKEHCLVLQKTLEEFLAVKKKLGGNIEMLRNSERFSKLALFLEMKKMGKEVSDTQFLLNNLVKAYKTPTLDVNIDERVQHFHSSVKTLGEIKVNLKSNTVDYRSGKLVLEKSLRVTGNSFLTDVEVIDGSYVVTACHRSCRLYFLDASGSRQSSFKLSGSPWGVTAFQDYQVCVAMQDPNLVGIFIVDIANLSITALKELRMTGKPFGICAVDEKLIVALSMSTGQVFKVYDKDGKYCEEHQVTKGNIRSSAIHAVSSKSLLYTSQSGHSVFSMNLNNVGIAATSKLHGGKINEMGSPVGITCDPEGNIYVACFYTHNVFQFDPSGKFIRQIIETIDQYPQVKLDPSGNIIRMIILDEHPEVRCPHGIRVKHLENDIKLLLVCQEKILIYQFSDS